MRPTIELPIILGISDNRIIIAFLKKTLKEKYYLLIADSPEEAFDILRSNVVDVIIVDEDFQNNNPFSLSTEVPKIHSYRKTPMLLITSQLKQSYTQQALKAGYTDFLNEPLDPNETFQRLSVALSPKRTEKKIAGLRPKNALNIARKPRNYSHASFFSELAKAKKVGLPVCMLILAEDNFAQILEEKGKAVAQKMIKAIEAEIKRHLRSADMLIMQKDGTFFLLLPKTSGSAGKAIAESIRQEIDAKIFTIGKEHLTSTLSIGLVHYEDKAHPNITEGSLFDRLVESAQRALDFAKKKGNRTALSSTDEEDHYELII